MKSWIYTTLLCLSIMSIAGVLGYNTGKQHPTNKIEINCNPNILFTELYIDQEGLITFSYVTANQVVRTINKITLAEFNKLIYYQPPDYKYIPPEQKNFKTQ